MIVEYSISGISFAYDETDIRPRTVSGLTLDEAFNEAIKTCVDEMNMSYGHQVDPEDDPLYQQIGDVLGGRSKEEIEGERERRRNEPPIGAGGYAWYNDPDNWRLEPEGGSKFLLVPFAGEEQEEAWNCVVEKFVNGKKVPIPKAELLYYVNRS